MKLFQIAIITIALITYAWSGPVCPSTFQIGFRFGSDEVVHDGNFVSSSTFNFNITQISVALYLWSSNDTELGLKDYNAITTGGSFETSVFCK
jgi:hypothetical protein